MSDVESLKQEAREKGIPVMQDEGLSFICDYIRAHNVRTILEIGSATGCSAIQFASVSEDIRIVTVELDEERFEQAVKNIADAGLSDRVHVIHGDALKAETFARVEAELTELASVADAAAGETPASTSKATADLIFLDAAKSQYIAFFEMYEKLLSPHGAIISDNLLFHGMTAGYRKTYNYNTIKLLRKIRGFIIYLMANKQFDTAFHTIGDGVSVSTRRE
ncbi:MAG: O-methyltransferase [Spirochaetaceae bacterium]|nr:O-methyltransferase [Spirochaetaceae bacterium]